TRVGLDQPLAGMLHGDRARAPGPAQDRDRPREPTVDHDRAGDRLPVLLSHGGVGRGTTPGHAAPPQGGGCWPASRYPPPSGVATMAKNRSTSDWPPREP